MSKSSQTETPLPDQTYSLANLLPAINRQWENDTHTPQWLGWFNNHLLGRIFLAYRASSHQLAVQQLRQTERALAEAFKDKSPEDIRYDLWDLLLTNVVPSILDKIEPMPELTKVLADATRLRLRKERNESVTSQQWNDLDEDIQQVQELITESSDRKDPASRRDHHRMLVYLLSIARSAALKNTHTSLANALRDTLNALEIFHEMKIPEPEKDAPTNLASPHMARHNLCPATDNAIISGSYMAETIISRFQRH
ncbi:MAG: hypothetical protein EON60_09505 [Alphaproteobacteria bacterium]|nr:MAG: hypothetical protein EON60_09505 [Alphaproteobacteria bacterium]